MRKGFRRYSGMFCSLLLVFVLLFCCSSIGYAEFALDPDFGNGGLVSTDFGLSSNKAYSIAIDSQGRLVAAGDSLSGINADFALARYTSAGDLDPDFGTGGIVSTDFGSGHDYAISLAIDNDGRIVVAGESYNGTDSDFGLARYTIDGDLDQDFGTGGIVSTDFGSGRDEAKSLAIDSQGRLVVAGKSDNNFALARYVESGDLDPSFGTGGIVSNDVGSGTSSANSLAIDDDGRLLVAGFCTDGTDEDFALARYKSDGDLDPDFGTGGIVSTDFGSGQDRANSLAIDDQGRIVVVGSSRHGGDYNFALARYVESGDLDPSFGTDGIVSTDFGSGRNVSFSLAIDSQGRLVVAGKSGGFPNEDFALARYKENGVLDTSFGTDGIISTDFGLGNDAAYSLVIDNDGRIVVAGESYNGTNSDFALARYKDSVEQSSGDGGCNISSLSALSILLVVPLMFLSKRGR